MKLTQNLVGVGIYRAKRDIPALLHQLEAATTSVEVSKSIRPEVKLSFMLEGFQVQKMMSGVLRVKQCS